MMYVWLVSLLLYNAGYYTYRTLCATYVAVYDWDNYIAVAWAKTFFPYLFKAVLGLVFIL